MKQSYAQDILLQLINNSDCHFHQVFEIIDSSSVCVFLMAEWNDNQGHILHVLLHNAKYDTMFVRFFFTEIEDVIPSFRDVVFINEVECCISQPSFRSDLKKIIKSQRGHLSVEEKQYITQSIERSLENKGNWRIIEPKLIDYQNNEHNTIY